MKTLDPAGLKWLALLALLLAAHFTTRAQTGVGIGTNTPHAALQLANALANRKLVLYETGDNDHEFLGFGVNGNTLRYQVANAADSHVFYRGDGGGASVELMRIAGNGNVGIGQANPGAPLDVNGAAWVRGTLVVDVTESNTGSLVNGLRMGNSASGEGMSSTRGGGTVNRYGLDFYTGFQRRLSIGLDGKVGIGTAAPSQVLDVRGNLRLGDDAGFNAAGVGNAFEFVGPGVNSDPIGFHRTNPANNNSELHLVLGDDPGGDPNSDKFVVGSTDASAVDQLTTAAFTPQLTILSNGSLGIGMSPLNRLDVQVQGRSGTHATGRPFYATGDVGLADNGFEFRHSNGTQGVGIGYASVYAAGSNPNQNLNLFPKGSGAVGIGTASPVALLDVNGNQYLRGILQFGTNDADKIFLTSVGANGSKIGHVAGWGVVQYAGPGNGATTGFHAWQTTVAGAYAEQMRLTSTGLGIGTTAPTTTLDVNGSLRVRGLAGTGTRLPAVAADGTLGLGTGFYTATPGSSTSGLVAGSSIATDAQPFAVAMSGTRAYVVTRAGNTLQLFDVAAPGAPVLLGSVSTGAGSSPRNVAVSGTMAYVLCFGTGVLQVYDVATPSAPALLGSVSVGAGSQPYGLAVSGTVAYVVNATSNALQLYNVATPSAPTLLGSVGTGSIPRSVAVSGTTAYVTNSGSNTLQTFNVATPSAPALLGTIGTDSTPRNVVVSGTRAYVVNEFGNTVQAFDVATPSVPTLLGSAATGSNPHAIAIGGSTVLVANRSGNTVQAFDVTVPGAPVLLSTISSGGLPHGVAVSGSTVVAVNDGAATMQVFSLTNTPRLLAVSPDGSVASVAVPGSTDFVQNRTTPQAGASFNVGGTGTVGGLLTAGGGAVVTGSVRLNGLAGTGSRVLTADASGNLAATQAFPDGTTFIQNQTAANQTGGFRISGNGLVGGTVGIGTATPHGLLDLGSSFGSSPTDPVTKKLAVYNNSAGTDFYGLGISPSALNIFAAANTTDGPKMTVLANGNVGIGTTGPGVPLDVQSVNANYSAFAYGYLSGAGAGTFNNGGGNVSVSIRAAGRMVCPEFNAVSDRRLKSVVGLSSGAADLALLSKLRITDYTMRDKVQFGERRFKKVIAQEVEEVFPQAVQQHTGFLPDVYALAVAVRSEHDSLLCLTLPQPLAVAVSAGQRLKLIGPKGETIATLARLAAIGSTALLLRGVPALAGKQVFVYGLEHNDVRAVDYDALAMLNVSATQELARKVAALEAKNAAQQAQLQQQTTRADKAEATLSSFEQRLRALEAAGRQARQ